MIYWLNNIDENDLSEVGSKSVNLAKIFKSNLEVPIGFVIPSSFYKSFISDLEIDDILKDLNVDDYENLRFVSRKIQLLVMDGVVDEEEIIDSYETLGADISKSGDQFVSLRLSPYSKLGESSYSSLKESFSNVKGKDDLLSHLKACYSSLFTTKLLYFRAKNNVDWKQIMLPVIVQVTVDADASGVVFCKNPSNNANEVVVEAVFGLGKGLEVTNPDVYLIDKSSNEIRGIKVNSKDVMFIKDFDSGKTISKQVPISKRNSQVLDDNLIQKLASFAKRAEALFGSPQRIEWALEKDKFLFLGSRNMK
jgi:pyruvate,water dikinase